MPHKPTGSLFWGSLLGACRADNNVSVSELLRHRLFEMNHKILLMKGKSVTKELGRSWVELEGAVHTLHSAECFHRRKKEVLSKVKSVSVKLKEAGVVHDLSCVLHDVDDEQKERMLLSHSEIPAKVAWIDWNFAMESNQGHGKSFYLCWSLTSLGNLFQRYTKEKYLLQTVIDSITLFREYALVVITGEY